MKGDSECPLKVLELGEVTHSIVRGGLSGKVTSEQSSVGAVKEFPVDF
jgi:hypothetical protein